MDSRGRRWSVASVGLQAGLSAITSPAIARFPSSWPNSPENQDSVFDSRHQISISPKAKVRSNSIGDIFSGSWIKNNSSIEETLRFKAPRLSLSMFQVSSKSNQKAGLSIVTLLNGNTILVYGQYGSELNNSLSKAKTDLKISNYCFISASVQTVQTLDASRGVIGSTLERIIEQDFDDEETNDEKAKKEIWSDLLRNENVYQQSLKNLHYIYAEPIRHLSYLRPEEHQQIFFGIESLISLSSTLISQLGSTLSNWDPNTSNIGSIFPSGIWTHYNEYYCKYPQIKNLLEQKLQEECPFAEFCQENRISSGQSVEDLLLLPCQRIPEYEQYLSSLLEKTEECQPDYQSLKEAIAQIKQILRGCYEDVDGTGQTENNKNHFLNSPTQQEKDKITENVQRRRKSSPGAVLFRNLGSAKIKFSRIAGEKCLEQDIVNFARYQSNVKRLYIMESAVHLTHSMQTQDRYLFLFDDILLVAKQKSNNQFKLKYYVRICEMWLATCLDEISEVSHDEEKSFVIGWPTLDRVATFPSRCLKEKWQTSLKQLIDEKKENEKPKEIQLKIQNADQKQTITMLVQNTAVVKEVVKKCLEQFQISKGDIDDYELWSEYGDNDSSPYPLIGHEIPYSIKMNHIRNSSENKDDCDNTEAKRKYDFLLMSCKKTPKKQNADDIDGKGLKKRRHHFNLFKKTAKLEEKPLGKLFGQPLKDVTINENQPKPIEDLLRLLFQQGPSISGIFRKPANAKKKRELCEMLDHEETINMADVTGNLAAAVLMEYLRNIPQGLLMDDKYTDWIDAGKLLNETEKLTKIQSLVWDLPPCNRQLLQQLMCILYYINKRSSENLMSSQNIATCITPSLLGSKQPDSQDDLMIIRDVISYLIENCVQIFGEEVIFLFGEVPSERLQEDSDTDSFHSTLSTLEPGGLHQSDDSSMHSLDREFSNAETESSGSGLSPATKRTYDHQLHPDSAINDVQHFREEGINAYEKIIVTGPLQKSDSQESEDSISSLSSNNPVYPVPPPRKNRQNYLGAKYKSMTSIDKTNQVPIKKDNSSQSENDLLAVTSDLSKDNRNLPDYHHKKLRSVQAHKKTLNSQIIMTEGQVPKNPARNPQQESVEQLFCTRNLSSISQHSDHEESPERDQRRTDRKNLGRIPHSKSVDELDHHHWQLMHYHQHQQQQHNTQALHSERKHLPPAPQSPCPLMNKSENQNENEIRLVLFENILDPSSAGKSSKEASLKIPQDLPRIYLQLSTPPNVLLQKIRQPLAATKREQSSKRCTSNTCKNSRKFDEEIGIFSNSKASAGSGQVPLNCTRQAYSENNQHSKKALNFDKKENISASPCPAASVEIPRKPKHPPSYEEAIQQKHQQHERSTFAENLYKESLKEYRQNSSADKKHVKGPKDERLISNHTKHSNPKFDKLYRKHIVNSPSPRKLAQGQYQWSAEKGRRKGTSPSNIASKNRLQRSLSISDSELNYLCSDASKTVRKYPAASSYSKVKTEGYTGLSDDDKKHRTLERTKITFMPGKEYKNATNQNSVLHKPLTKTKSVDFTINQKRTVDSYSKSKQPVLPWSVSEMINRFAVPNDELPYPHNLFK